MGIEPTWDFVEPHHGFEDQERHQVALRLQENEPRCSRLAPQGSVSTFNKRGMSPAVMKQLPSYLKLNTDAVRQIVPLRV
jgi:hypothetical protein